MRSTGDSAVPGLFFAIPPSLHRGAAGSSFSCTHSSPKDHKTSVFLPLAKGIWETGEQKRFFQAQNTWAAADLLCLQDLPPQSNVFPPKKGRDISIVKNELHEQHLPSPKHCIGILVFPLLQSSLIYPKPTSLLQNTNELHRMIPNVMNGHHVWVDDSMPPPCARQSFQIPLHRQCTGWNGVLCSFHVQTAKREGKPIKIGNVLLLKWSSHKVLTFPNNLISVARHRIHPAADADAVVSPFKLVLTSKSILAKTEWFILIKSL